MNNLANTPTPLSPEEAYLASKLLGKSLFSAIQLTKEVDRMKELQQHEANDVLKIPLPVQKMGEEELDQNITYYKTEADIAGKRARGFREKRDDINSYLMPLAGAATAGLAVPAFRAKGIELVRNLGKSLTDPKQIDNVKNLRNRIARYLQQKPDTVYSASLAAPVAGLGTASLYNSVRARSEDRNASKALKKTNEVRKNRAKSKTEKTADELEGKPPGIIGRALRFNRNPIRTLVGGEAGFSEARREYYEMEKQQINKALRQAQEEYLSTLQSIKQGEETPLVDAFCNGMANQLTMPELLKDAASAESVEIGDGSIKRLIKKTLGVATKPVQPVIDLGATGLLGTAGGTGYLAYVLKKKMREKDQDKFMTTELPTRVELEPYYLK
jgi:hypothetical protein